MSYLYVSEQGASIGIEANRFQVKYKDGMIKSIPAETLEMIEVFGSVQITTRCLTECLKRGVNILFYSTSGAYYGRLISTSHVNVQSVFRRKSDTMKHLNWKCQKESLMQRSAIRLLFCADMREAEMKIFIE